MLKTIGQNEYILMAISILKLAVPAIGSSMLMMAYNIIDIGYIGQLGRNEVAAVGSAGFYMNFAWAISSIITVGASIKITHAIGAKKNTLKQKYINNSITNILILSVLITSLFWIFRKQLIGFFNLGNEIVIHQSISYLQIVSSGFIFTFLNFLIIAIFTAHGNTKQPFYINAGGLLLNIFLDPIFIFSLGMGVRGAAYATLISNLLMTIVFIWVLIKKLKISYKLNYYSFEKTKNIVLLGITPALQRIAFSSIAIFIARIISHWGTTAIAAQKIGLQIEAFSFMSMAGFSLALSTIIGQAYGANDFNKLFKAYNTALVMVSVLSLIMSIVFISYPKELFSLVINDSQVINMGVDYLRIIGYSQIFAGIEFATMGVFYGMGKTHIPAFSSIGLTAMRIPLAFIVLAIFTESINAIWWSISLSSMAKGLTMVFLFVRVFSIKNKFKPSLNRINND